MILESTRDATKAICSPSDHITNFGRDAHTNYSLSWIFKYRLDSTLLSSCDTDYSCRYYEIAEVLRLDNFAQRGLM